MDGPKILEKILSIGRKVIPKKLFEFAQPIYHYALAVLGAVIYRFPAKKLTVIGVTGTKGKTTTTELINAIFEEAGHRTALASTLRFKVGDKEKRNLFKMTMPGRFFMQKLLRDAVGAGCSHAILEMTSEGAKQFRHKFIYLDALVFTNLAPEHIESHGSYENYLKAKLSIAKELETNRKKNSFGPAVIANADDKEGEKFLSLNIKNKIPYSLKDATNIKTDEEGSFFQIGKTVIRSKLPGIFNVSNMLGAIACARHFGISDETVKNGIGNLNMIRGRMEKIDMGNLSVGRFDIIVDYAHTPDSLRAVYETYGSTRSNYLGQAGSSQAKKYKTICVLGNTGGGRDTWKRKVMGGIADQYCDQIILTNEDPYDEDPRKIMEEMKSGIKEKPVEIIMDRRTAIRTALEKACAFQLASPAQGPCNENVAVLITGKGTDPYIMGPNGSKQKWDDATVVREELEKISHNL